MDGAPAGIRFVRAAHAASVDLDDPAWDLDIDGRHITWPLRGVSDLAGRTGIRDLMRLIYHADGVICPITFALHLAAGLPAPPGRKRWCIELAGGREPPMLTRYPDNESHVQRTLYVPMECNSGGGCWKSHTAGIGKPEDQCLRPTKIGNAHFAECMTRLPLDRLWESLPVLPK